ncbi:PadR family transcriptional regulator [Flexithrix dorotheae]|uniref:PadR family transcriptional regulator n=1 Tax=Flexithrix dorotheae TaxID=70993 RepID=UPI00036C5826|nr:PadR family transcriptional regulator [Flexithrix dorotheae]
MNLENTQVQMRKGILEFCILKIISKGEVYATDVLAELKSARMMVVEGTLYPLLTRLRKAELVDYKWVESTSGPPRKYYTLTEKGIGFLAQLTNTWEELITSTNQILEHIDGKKKKSNPIKEVEKKTKPAPSKRQTTKSAKKTQKPAENDAEEKAEGNGEGQE